jgi:hypothetical protein
MMIAKDFFLSDSTSEFLTNAPTTQYANLEDYGTIAFTTAFNLDRIRLKYYDSDNIQIGSTQTVNRTFYGWSFYYLHIKFNILYYLFWLFSWQLTKLVICFSRNN